MKLFITGIGTDVGKTIASSIIVEALEADYWKPIQAGDLHFSDSDKVKSLISNSKTQFHPNSYQLKTPASPHFSAELDGISIDLKKIKVPHDSYQDKNHLVIEAAGGILVPLNNNDCVIDLIRNDYKVIVVSRHYLGSINHTLLTIEALLSRNIQVAGIIFSGDENKSTETIILNKTKAKLIGRIENEPYFDQNVISYYAENFRDNLVKL